MKYEDLPPEWQAQVRDKIGRQPKKRDRTGAGKTATDGVCECGQRFTSTTLWERHADAEGHHRFELLRVEP